VCGERCAGLTRSLLCFVEFYVLLTMHLGSFLINNPVDAQFFFVYIYSNSLHISSTTVFIIRRINCINPLNPELDSICYLVALLGAHHFLHVSRIRVKSLTFRLLMSYIYGAPILDVSRSHTTTQHSR